MTTADPAVTHRSTSLGVGMKSGFMKSIPGAKQGELFC